MILTAARLTRRCRSPWTARATRSTCRRRTRQRSARASTATSRLLDVKVDRARHLAGKPRRPPARARSQQRDFDLAQLREWAGANGVVGAITRPDPAGGRRRVQGGRRALTTGVLGYGADRMIGARSGFLRTSTLHHWAFGAIERGGIVVRMVAHRDAYGGRVDRVELSAEKWLSVLFPSVGS